MTNETQPPLEIPLGFDLFGPNAEQLRAAADALDIDFEAIVSKGVKLMENAKQREAEMTDEIRTLCDNNLDLVNTVLGCCHITHAIETARSSLGAMLKHNILGTAEVQQMVTGCVVGLAESSNAFAGATMNKVCDLLFGIGEEAERRQAIFDKINEVTIHKRDTFALVERINEDLMLRLQQGAQKAVDEKRLGPTDMIAGPAPAIH